MPPIRIQTQRTASTEFRKDSRDASERLFVEAATALIYAGNDLCNSTAFLIRNVLASSDPRTKALKPESELHANQKAMLALFDAGVSKERAKGRAKGREARLSSETGWNPFKILDQSILDNAYRLLTDRQGKALQKRIPATAATEARQLVAREFSSWIRSPVAGKGMPGFKAKGHESRPLQFQGQSLGGRLPDISGYSPLWIDAKDSVPLSDEARAAWSAFPLQEALRKLRRSVGSQDDAKLLVLRILPARQGVRLQAVFAREIEFDPNSFAGKVLARAGMEAKTARKRDGSPAAVQPAGPAWDGEKAEAALLEALKNLPKGDWRLVAGLDLGIVNAGTLAFGSGRLTAVTSGRHVAERLLRLDRKLDEMKGRKAGPRLKALRSLRDQARAANAKLDPKLFEELKGLEAALWKDGEVVALLCTRERLVLDSVRQLAAGWTKFCVEEGVQAVVIGKNDLWKRACDLGKKTNRRFHAIPHAKIINAFRSSLLDDGILSCVVEESYTSVSSFAASEPVKSRPARLALAVKQAAESVPSSPVEPETTRQIQPTKQQSKQQRQTPPLGGTSPPKPREPRAKRLGVRGRVPGAASGSRNRFVSKGVKGRWESLHADANGAFNIVRKAVGGFAPDKSLSSGFELFRLGSHGLRPMALGPGKRIQTN